MKLRSVTFLDPNATGIAVVNLDKFAALIKIHSNLFHLYIDGCAYIFPVSRGEAVAIEMTLRDDG